MLANPRRGKLDSMARLIHGLITTLMATLSRWLSKHRLELTP